MWVSISSVGKDCTIEISNELISPMAVAIREFTSVVVVAPTSLAVYTGFVDSKAQEGTDGISLFKAKIPEVEGKVNTLFLPC